ncbi:MAG: bifunctional DNA primase/polymerase [Leucobacter sp.]
MATIQDALSLAAAGWRILPLRGKIPLTRHGVKDASANPDQVRQWWAGRAQHNIGARVPGHLMVLDLDPRNGGTLNHLEAAHGGPLPETLTVYSGRGDGGRHLYYRHPGGRLSARRLPEGIDVKTESGYCVMPPSMHPDTGQPYQWGSGQHPAPLPQSLLTLLQPPAPKRAEYTPLHTGNNGRDTQAKLAKRAGKLAQHVAAAAEGNRNARLFWAACQAVRDGHPRPTFDLLAEAAQHSGLSDSEAWQTINSALRTERSTS